MYTVYELRAIAVCCIPMEYRLEFYDAADYCIDAPDCIPAGGYYDFAGDSWQSLTGRGDD